MPTQQTTTTCIGWLFCSVVEDNESPYHMDSLIVPTSPEPNVLRPGGTAGGSELWEVILVASCPIIFIVFLCFCVVCLLVRSYERPNSNLGDSGRSQGSQIASILRQLPPPPKYDIAVTSVDAPPPLYSDIGKEMSPIRTTPNGARPIMGRHFTNQHHLTTPTMQPLNIQYLYPPKYEATETTSSSSPPTQVTIDMGSSPSSSSENPITATL